jgi:aryl-alcohol dehydrogenase-like predicted oxidoreductase
MNRREFIRKSATLAPALGLFPADLTAITRELGMGKTEKRSLGKTGEMLSMIGFGGIVVMNVSADEAARSVRNAIDAGINYFDVAPSYGNAETMLGPALEPYRKDVFLSCKTGKRDKAGAREELEQSLKFLRTDYFDLYQLHAVSSVEDVHTLLGKGGAMETCLEAQKEGKIRYLGFSAHTVEAAMALMNGFDFDTIMFPFNYASWNKGNFGPQVLEIAKEKQMGIIALKAMAKGKWPQDADRSKYPKAWYEPLSNREDALQGLRFTLSHPVTTAIPPGEPSLFQLALDLRHEIHPMMQEEIDQLKIRSLEYDPLFSHQG